MWRGSDRKHNVVGGKRGVGKSKMIFQTPPIYFIYHHRVLPFLHIYFPPENEHTAHFPLQAHFLAPLSPPPPSIAFNSSSLPFSRPTTTSALHVLSDRILSPEPGPRGPMASVKGVVGSHCPWDLLVCANRRVWGTWEGGRWEMNKK